jgi:hypothetical protein
MCKICCIKNARPIIGRMYDFNTPLDPPTIPFHFLHPILKSHWINSLGKFLLLLRFRHIECNTSKTPGSKRWPALATWILEGVPTNRVGRNAFFYCARDLPAFQSEQRAC